MTCIKDGEVDESIQKGWKELAENEYIRENMHFYAVDLTKLEIVKNVFESFYGLPSLLERVGVASNYGKLVKKFQRNHDKVWSLEKWDKVVGILERCKAKQKNEVQLKRTSSFDRLEKVLLNWSLLRKERRVSSLP